jgi:hypothetical protein
LTSYFVIAPEMPFDNRASVGQPTLIVVQREADFRRRAKIIQGDQRRARGGIVSDHERRNEARRLCHRPARNESRSEGDNCNKRDQPGEHRAAYGLYLSPASGQEMQTEAPVRGAYRALAVPANVPATACNPPKTSQRQPTTKRKTLR